MASPLETYLRELGTIRSSGAAVKETSFYGPLAELLNEVGAGLKPQVRCVINLRDQGAGLPDGGLFTPDQFAADGATDSGQIPARGAIEVKGTGEAVDAVALGEQVGRYWARYRQVLVTNYRDFALVGRGADGRKTVLESYRLAENEAAFWQSTARPRATAAAHEARFVEYLKRVMLYPAPLRTPGDVAWFLASYARDAKARVEGADLPALDAIRKALEGSLGIAFQGEKGDHFFRSTLVQTLFYGVFSAWVLWCKGHPPADLAARFDWRTAAWLLHVPMIRALFEQVATPGQLGPLGLVEVLDWTADALNRVDRASFFERFEEAEAVPYFYEPFLQAFDPDLRKELGVWYTPPEIVRYMVERVDRVLREELDIPDGLADPRVYVLDPCCGTGAYVVEVLRRIERTLRDRSDALIGSDLKRAATGRVFGFELLPAPFVIAHLQVGLFLQRAGAPLVQEKERAGVFLTNALTGWEERPLADLHRWPELEDERRAAGEVKREKPILVVLGNPPYNAFAGVSPAEEEGMVEVYKGAYEQEIRPGDPKKAAKGKGKTRTRYRLSDPESAGGYGIKKFNLDDLYVRFFRLAERRVAEKTGKGVVCFISNHSYLVDPSFVVMREHLLSGFDAMWFDGLNGDSRETGKLTPTGRPDPSVFSTDINREGIRVGTAVALLVRSGAKRRKSRVVFREFWGASKRADLLASLNVKKFSALYRSAAPDRSNRYKFRPSVVSAHYREWPRLTDLCAVAPGNGLMEKRGGALIDIDRERLERRLRAYFDPGLDWDAFRALGHGLTESQARFDPKAARKKAQAAERFARERVVRYAVRPFDVRWCYYTGVRPVWNEPRPSLWAQCWAGNAFLIARPAGVAVPEGAPVGFTRVLGDNDAFRGHAYYFPLMLKNGDRLTRRDHTALFDLLKEKPEEDEPVANLSGAARSYLRHLKIKNFDRDPTNAGLIWMHALAVGFSPAYLAENADGVREDWPRVPLPDDRKALLASARLGRTLAGLLDTEGPVEGVTTGKPRDEMKVLGVIARVGGGALAGPDDLSVTAGWGRPGKEGVIMPGKGRVVEREYAPEELAAIGDGAVAVGMTLDTALACLGRTTRDIYLNDVASWRNVPARVWDFTVGGYPVLKKWLSYRERPVLGRALTAAEVREVASITRRLAAVRLLEPQLDANYAAVTATAYPWPSQ